MKKLLLISLLSLSIVPAFGMQRALDKKYKQETNEAADKAMQKSLNKHAFTSQDAIEILLGSGAVAFLINHKARQEKLLTPQEWANLRKARTITRFFPYNLMGIKKPDRGLALLVIGEQFETMDKLERKLQGSSLFWRAIEGLGKFGRRFPRSACAAVIGAGLAFGAKDRLLPKDTEKKS